MSGQVSKFRLIALRVVYALKLLPILFIQWSYVFATYVRSAGDRPIQVER